jgi:DNA-binding NarL/FixJ family response regulator
VRVVVADDAALIRSGIVKLLQEFDCEVVAEVADGDSLVEAVVAHRPDVAVVDVRMPPSFTDEGLRAVVAARARVPGAPVLILSQYVEVSYADDLLADARGAVGYLLKDRVVDVEEFMDGLRRVAAGGTVFDPQVVSQLMVHRRNDPLSDLTDREREVLALMAQGHSNQAMARSLVVSDGAVEKHIRNIFTKLNLYAEDTDHHRRVRAVLAYLRSPAGSRGGQGPGRF